MMFEYGTFLFTEKRILNEKQNNDHKPFVTNNYNVIF